jgi:proteasome accessory factor B
MIPSVKKGSKSAGTQGGRDDRGKRLLDLVVMLLGARNPVPYREIRAQFKAYRTAQEEAGLRAFERDKADLLELGVPLKYITPDEDDSIEEAGYSVDFRKYRLPEIHLTPAEVGALVLAGSVARAAPGTTYAEVVDLALKKLAFDQRGGAPAREPVLVDFPAAETQGAFAERLAQLEQAIGNQKRITMTYVKSNAESGRREIEPYGLFYRHGTWSVVGKEKEGMRTFRVDRIQEMEVAPRPKTPDFERPASFDLRRYANRSPWTFEIEPPIALQLEIRPEAGAIAHEDLGEKATRTPLAGGGTLVEMPCANPEFVIARVLAAKGGLVVRGPSELRRRVTAELERVLGKYA